MDRSVRLASNIGSSGRNVVAVIGIDRYAMWRRLDNAVNDATGALSLFQRLGFEQVTAPLLDERATGDAMMELVTDQLMALGSDDSLVVFYAGHGGTRTQRVAGKQIKTGYLIPVDASDDPSKIATWIDLDAWLRNVSKLPPRHIVVILDACYSGVALSPVVKWGRDGGASQAVSFSTLHARYSRLIITSALDDEVALDSGPVPGHSLFTGCLIEALTGGLPGDLQWNGRRVATASDIGRYIRRRVQTYPGRPGWRQTPDFGSFDFDDRGEMLVPLLVEDPAPAAAAVAASQRDPGASGDRVEAPRARRGVVLLELGCAVAAVIALALGVGSPEAGTVPTDARSQAPTADDAGVSAAVPGDGPSESLLGRPAQPPQADRPPISDRGTGTSTPPIAKPERPGMIRVLGDAADAHAFVDGKDAGTVPADITVKSGPHVVQIRAPDYQSSPRHVTVTAGSSKIVKFERGREASSDTGTLKVVSTVPDAVVSVDGVVLGKVPQEQAMAPGDHAVVVRLDGYQPFEHKVRVEPGQVATVKAELTAAGRLRVLSTPANAAVAINGAPAGVTPLDVDVPPGEIKLRLDLAGFTPFEQMLVIRGGKTETLWRELTRERH